MALGTIEAGTAANGFWVSLEPRFQVLDAPGLFDDVLHGYRMLNDPGDPHAAWRRSAPTRASKSSRPASTAR